MAAPPGSDVPASEPESGGISRMPRSRYDSRMPRTALIVDDSRTALAALGRLLKAQGIAVDTAESGPEALDFLRSNANPGVVFLDHMMPGMDGFQTLGALKTNFPTAAIPVVMYTSKEGDIYMGQALALGAVGVLRKPVDPVELAAILQRVDRLPASPIAVNTTGPGQPRAAVTGVVDVPNEFRSPAPPIESQPSGASARSTPPSAIGRAGGIGARLWPALLVLLLLPTTWYYQRFRQSERTRVELQNTIEQLQSEQQRLQAREAATATASPRVAPAPRDPPEARALLDALVWAINQSGQYAWNEEPLGDLRLNQVRELVARLGAAGFHGTVHLETHVGNFCLARDEQGGYRLPNDTSAFARCEVVIHPPALAKFLSQRQSPGFARYLAQQDGEGIVVTVVPYGNDRPLMAYPDPGSTQTAGDWNQVARLNQRVEVELVPAP